MRKFTWGGWFWDPYRSMGMPRLQDLGMRPLYPPQLLPVRFLPTPAAWHWNHVIHVLIKVAGLVLFCAALGSAGGRKPGTRYESERRRHALGDRIRQSCHVSDSAQPRLEPLPEQVSALSTPLFYPLKPRARIRNGLVGVHPILAVHDEAGTRDQLYASSSGRH
jgi:hypothetical protein